MQFIKLTKAELLDLKETRPGRPEHFILEIQVGDFPPLAETVRLQEVFCSDHRKQEQFLISFNRAFSFWHLDSDEIKEVWRIIH